MHALHESRSSRIWSMLDHKLGDIITNDLWDGEVTSCDQVNSYITTRRSVNWFRHLWREKIQSKQMLKSNWLNSVHSLGIITIGRVKINKSKLRNLFLHHILLTNSVDNRIGSLLHTESDLHIVVSVVRARSVDGPVDAAQFATLLQIIRARRLGQSHNQGGNQSEKPHAVHVWGWNIWEISIFYWYTYVRMSEANASKHLLTVWYISGSIYRMEMFQWQLLEEYW